MPRITGAELQALAVAVNSNDLQRIDAILKPHIDHAIDHKNWTRSGAKYRINEIELCFLTACRIELKNVIAKYLELRTFTTIILSFAMNMACGEGWLETVKALPDAPRLARWCLQKSIMLESRLACGNVRECLFRTPS